MAKTVVGMFDNFDDAQSVVQDLTNNGFDRNDISLVANDANKQYQDIGRTGNDKMDDTPAEQAGSGAVGGTVAGGALGLLVGLGALAIPGVGPIIAAGPLAVALGSTALGAGIGAASGAIVGPLVDAGIPRPDAEMYSEGVRRGGTLVMVHTDDDMASTASDIMSRHNVVDIDSRGEEFRSSGWSNFDENAEPYSADDINNFRTTRTTSTGTTRSNTMDTTRSVSDTTNRTLDQGEQTLPVIEEEVQVGKRQVQGGTARIHTKVTEQPVEEQVNLREERVHVERRPVDRPIGDADTAFREQSFEVTETSEEPVVSKQARVVEEVVVGKDVRERTETVHETARRQDVHVHENEGTTQRAVGTSGFETYDADFRNHYQTNYASTGADYNSYGPVYRYGYNLAGDERYRDQDWTAVESDARTRWEERNPGTWEQFKDGVRYAWDKARGRA